MLKRIIKGLLNDPNEQTYEKVGERWLSHHDRSHLEVAALQPVTICGYSVSGIDGVCIPEFNNGDDEPRYSGYLDECRVAIHQFLAHPATPCGCARAMYWGAWLLRKGDNPFRVFFDHWRTLH